MRLTRLGARNTNVAELGISATDTLYLPGRADPVALTNFSPIRQSNGDLQINLTGIDFTSFIGGLAWIVGDRPGPGVAGGRHRITVTPGADILAGALSNIAVTVTGAHKEGGVIATHAPTCRPASPTSARGLGREHGHSPAAEHHRVDHHRGHRGA